MTGIANGTLAGGTGIDGGALAGGSGAEYGSEPAMSIGGNVTFKLSGITTTTATEPGEPLYYVNAVTDVGVTSAEVFPLITVTQGAEQFDTSEYDPLVTDAAAVVEAFDLLTVAPSAEQFDTAEYDALVTDTSPVDLTINP